MKTPTKLLPALVCLFWGHTAFAAMIDFTDEQWATADGEAEFYDAELGVTLNADPAGEGAELNYSSNSGMGVDLDDPWMANVQIEGVEVLTVSFDEFVIIEDIFLTNLYDWGAIQIEVGEYTLEGEDPEQFVAENWYGDKQVSVNSGPIKSITFKAVGDWSGFADSGFSVEKITFSLAGVSVPELDPTGAGSAFALIFGGAIVLMGRRRRAA